MTTKQIRTRTLYAEHTGAVRLLVELAAGLVTIGTDDTEVDTAEVRLEPVTPGDALAEDLIDHAEVHDHGDYFEVRVPSPATSLASGDGALQATVRAPAGSMLTVRTFFEGGS